MSRHGMLRLLVAATLSDMQSGDMELIGVAHDEGIIADPGHGSPSWSHPPLLRTHGRWSAADHGVAVLVSIEDAKGWMVA